MRENFEASRSVDQSRFLQRQRNIEVKLANEKHVSGRSNARQHEYRQRIQHLQLGHDDKRSHQNRHAGDEHRHDDVHP
ncbi:hypothetical protein D3C74_410190 [compost metagenome]